VPRCGGQGIAILEFLPHVHYHNIATPIQDSLNLGGGEVCVGIPHAKRENE
jgi:hypothetical protein